MPIPIPILIPRYNQNQYTDRFRVLPKGNFAILDYIEVMSKTEKHIHQVSPLETLFNDRQARSAMAVFQVQFQQQLQVKTEKRGQQPFMISNKAEIRETMLSYGPPVLHCPKDPQFGNADRAISQVSQYGSLPSCVVNGASERQGLATLRDQTCGKKEVAFSISMSVFDASFIHMRLRVWVQFCLAWCVILLGRFGS